MNGVPVVDFLNGNELFLVFTIFFASLKVDHCSQRITRLRNDEASASTLGPDHPIWATQASPRNTKRCSTTTGKVKKS
jgi:hypothetical protein